MGSDYAGRIDPTDEAWKSSSWAELLKERYRIAALFCEKRVVLDSCCGTGWGTTNFIVPRARFTFGFDICPSAAETNKASDEYAFAVMDARKTDLEEHSFDIVLSLDAIEHFTLEDGARYLQEMNRVCNKHGLVIGTTPLVIDDSFIPMFLRSNKYHHCMYTRRTLHRTLQSVFSVVRIYEVYSRFCPYFLFVCANTRTSASSETEQKIKRLMLQREAEFKREKLSNYLSWAKGLIRRKRLPKAGYLLCLACLIRIGMLWSGRKNNGANECL